MAWKESGTILDERIPETTIDFANATFAEGYYVNDPIGSDNLMATDFNTTEPIIVCWDGNYYQFYQAGMSGSGSGATWTFKTEATDEVFFVLITDGTIVVASTDNGVHTFRLGFGGTTSSVHTIAPEYIGGWDNVGSKGYVSLVKKQTVTIENDNGFVKLDGSIPAENAGKKCIVRIDDSPYECDVLYLAEWNATVIGNLSFADGSANDSGEPFCIAYNEADGTEMMTKLEAGEYTVEVVVAGVEKIPAKYLPDNIGGGVIVFDTEANNTIEDVKNLVNAYNEGKAVVIRAVWMGT